MRYLLLIAASITAPVFAACAPTPLAASQASLQSGGDTQISSGYRATAAIVDKTTARIWIRVIACGHPERPAILVPLYLPIALEKPSAVTPPHSSSQPLVVHAGQALRLHSVSDKSRIEISGIAEQQGAIGQAIRVHLVSGFTSAANTPARQLVATITAQGEAELQP